MYLVEFGHATETSTDLFQTEGRDETYKETDSETETEKATERQREKCNIP